VIVPAYNAASTVGMAVDSVLAQSCGDFELLVIDDGSSDGTAEVVRVRQDPRVRCATTANGGVARARNHGLGLASGDLVAFLDADDLWHPTKLERQLQMMTRWPSVGLCFTAAEHVDGDLRRIGEDPAVPYPDYCEALLTVGNVVSGGGSSAMARHDLVEHVGGFDPGLSQVADWDLWLRLSLETEFAPISDSLVRYRKTTGTMSGDPTLLERDTFAMLDKFFAGPGGAPRRGLHRRAYGRQWMVCSGTYLHAGRLGDSLRCLRRGVAADPRSLRRPLLLPARVISRALGSRVAAVSKHRAGA
jgi:glycosyltransferase involved in cell wall biosynthesis